MRSVILVLATSAIALAQGPGGIGRGIATGPTLGGAGFGRILFPGTGAPAAIVNPGARPIFPRAPFVGHSNHARGTGASYYPVFYGGGYYPYDAPPAPEASVLPPDYGMPGIPQQAPVVIINQNFRPDVVNPVLRDYSNVPLPEAIPQQPEPPPQTQPQAVAPRDDSPTIYLIAMKDRTIFATVAYWVDGETLNYVTRDGSLNHATLGLVDRDFSKQLNDERHVEFKLPKTP
jgi:hypothetical protein